MTYFMPRIGLDGVVEASGFTRRYVRRLAKTWEIPIPTAAETHEYVFDEVLDVAQRPHPIVCRETCAPCDSVDVRGGCTNGYPTDWMMSRRCDHDCEDGRPCPRGMTPARDCEGYEGRGADGAE